MMKNIAAALIFFTRLPFWRIKCFEVAPKYYAQVIYFWSATGWLTGGMMALTLWLGGQILPMSIAVILAILCRLLITGALHEDGLADFFDGFGGGRTKERILAIMKDSHIGTYGCLSLIIYFLLLYNLLTGMSLKLACVTILIGDPLCKYISSQMTFFLPYARTEETSKSKTVYEKITFKTLFISACFGLIPLIVFFHWQALCAILFPMVVFGIMIGIMQRKIQGYTGDCCGSLFLLCELSYYLGTTIIYHHGYIFN